MPLTLVSPPPAWAYTASGSSVSTAAFTPPAGGVLVAQTGFDTSNTERTATITRAPTSSTSAWTQIQRQNVGAAMVTTDWATVTNTVSATVTCTWGGGVGTPVADGCLAVFAFTGQRPVTPIGQSGKGAANATGSFSFTVTPTAPGSIVLITYCAYEAGPYPTSPQATRYGGSLGDGSSTATHASFVSSELSGATTFTFTGTTATTTYGAAYNWVEVVPDTTGQQLTASLNDTAAVTDSATRVLTAVRTLTDAAAAGDTASWQLSSAAQSPTRTVTDTAAIGDSASWSLALGAQTLTRTLTDGAAVTDSASWARSEPNPQRTAIDTAAIGDTASWQLSAPVLGDYQFVLLGTRIPRMIFGLGSSIVVHPDGFDPAYGDLRTQDQHAPQGDWRRFGADKRTPGVWSWEAWTDAHTPAQALDLVDAMAEAWDAEYTRETPGEVLALQYKIPGRPVRRLYGRPRNFQSSGGPLIQHGRLDLSFELHRVEDVTYDEQEESVPVYLGKPGGVTPSPWRFPLRFPTSTRTNTEPRVEQVVIGGRLRTWVTLGIRGPVVNPWVQIGDRRWALTGQVPSGRMVWLSGLPWAQTVWMDDGTFRPDMLDARARLGLLRFEPGSYPVTFGGYDPTGTASAEVRWRNAYRGW